MKTRTLKQQIRDKQKQVSTLNKEIYEIQDQVYQTVELPRLKSYVGRYFKTVDKHFGQWDEEITTFIQIVDVQSDNLVANQFFVDSDWNYGVQFNRLYATGKLETEITEDEFFTELENLINDFKAKFKEKKENG